MCHRKTKELREMEIILSRNGFKAVRSNGSHFTYLNRTTGRHVTVNKDLNPMVRKRIIKENALVQEGWFYEVHRDFTERELRLS